MQLSFSVPQNMARWLDKNKPANLSRSAFIKEILNRAVIDQLTRRKRRK